MFIICALRGYINVIRCILNMFLEVLNFYMRQRAGYATYCYVSINAQVRMNTLQHVHRKTRVLDNLASASCSFENLA